MTDYIIPAELQKELDGMNARIVSLESLSAQATDLKWELDGMRARADIHNSRLEWGATAILDLQKKVVKLGEMMTKEQNERKLKLAGVG